jgi:hypothetical protein
MVRTEPSSFLRAIEHCGFLIQMTGKFRNGVVVVEAGVGGGGDGPRAGVGGCEEEDDWPPGSCCEVEAKRE